MYVSAERMTRVDQLRAEAVSVRDRMAAAQTEVAAVRANLAEANKRLMSTTDQVTRRLAEIARELTDTGVVSALGECMSCAYLGRIEWCPGGVTRVVHETASGTHICRIR